VVNNYIHFVVKTEEPVSTVWMDNRVATACKFGLTPIYDEFNRSRPEANNVLLGIFEERVSPLELKGRVYGNQDFRISCLVSASSGFSSSRLRWPLVGGPGDSHAAQLSPARPVSHLTAVRHRSRAYRSALMAIRPLGS